MMPVALCAAGIFLSPVRAAEEQATIAPLAKRALLLDAQISGDRIVTVGERGHILISMDQGKAWRQVPVPTRNTLTAVAFADEKVLIAVGHQGTVLRSEDAGESWRNIETASAGEGSFLDTIFLSPLRGIMVGAYGLYYTTDDGGLAWERRRIADDGFHYNRIVASADGTLYIVGEAGTVLRSGDSGDTWEPIPTPYEGSFFGFLALRDGSQLLFGLRGHVYRSTTQGDDWEEVGVPAPTLLMAGVELPDGRILLAGQSGNFLLSHDGARSFSIWHWGALTGVAEILATPDGGLLVFGEAGVRRIEQPAAQKAGNRE